MDIIFIEGLTLSANIGIHPWEKQVRQPIELDLQLTTDTSIAAEQDNLNDALDYEAIAKVISAFINLHSFALLETLAERLIQHLFSLFPTTTITLKISKKSALVHARTVGVLVKRTRTSNTP